MKGTCIAIDVSKDKSEVQGSMCLEEAAWAAFEISHDQEGLEKVRDWIALIYNLLPNKISY